MTRAGYTLTRRQHRWLKQQALDRGTDASAVLRDLLDRARRDGEQPGEGEQA